MSILLEFIYSSEIYSIISSFMLVLIPVILKIYTDISLMFSVAMRSDILWVILPMFTSVIFVEFYFGMYKNERMGGDTSTTHGLLLIWAGINEIKYLGFSSFGNLLEMSHLIALSVLFIGVIITFVSFFHVLSGTILLTISSVLITYYLAFLSLIFVFSNELFYTISPISPVVLFVGLYAIFNIIKYLEPARF